MSGVEAALVFGAIVLILLALSTSIALYRLSRLEEERQREKARKAFDWGPHKPGRYM